MTNLTELSNKELSEAIDFHRRQRNMSRGVNESAHMRQTQVVRLLEAEEARRLDEAVNEKQIRKDLDSGMSHDVVIGKHANKNTTNTDEIRKVIKQHAWDNRMKKEEVELDEGHYHVSWGGPSLSHTVMNAKSAEHAVASAKAHLIKKIPKLADEKYSDTFDKKPRVTNITNEEVSVDAMKSAQKKTSDSLSKPGPQGKTLPFNRFRSTNGGVNISAKNEEIEESAKSKMMAKLDKNVDPAGYHSSEDAEKHAHDINKHQLKMK